MYMPILPQSAGNNMESVENPCMLEDARLTYNKTLIFSSECVNENSNDIFGFGFSAPPNSALVNESVTFIGTGNATGCSDVIHNVFNLANCSDLSVCINNTYFWPPVSNSGTFLVSFLTLLC